MVRERNDYGACGLQSPLGQQRTRLDDGWRPFGLLVVNIKGSVGVLLDLLAFVSFDCTIRHRSGPIVDGLGTTVGFWVGLFTHGIERTAGSAGSGGGGFRFGALG